MTGFQYKRIYKNRRWAGFGPWAIVCQPLVFSNHYFLHWLKFLSSRRARAITLNLLIILAFFIWNRDIKYCPLPPFVIKNRLHLPDWTDCKPVVFSGSSRRQGGPVGIGNEFICQLTMKEFEARTQSLGSTGHSVSKDIAERPNVRDCWEQSWT